MAKSGPRASPGTQAQPSTAAAPHAVRAVREQQTRTDDRWVGGERSVTIAPPASCHFFLPHGCVRGSLEGNRLDDDSKGKLRSDYPNIKFEF